MAKTISKNLKKKIKEEKLRIYLSRMASALIQLGQNKIVIKRVSEDCAVITGMSKECKYKLLKVYADGMVQYCDKAGNPMSFGSAKTIPIIKEDLLSTKT
jgi:hypothetical protein